MSDQSGENKALNENGEQIDEKGSVKRSHTEQSLNTKNFIRKMTAKKGEIQQKAQTKITAFMNFSNSTSHGTGQKDQINSLANLTPQDQRIKDLEERMKQRDLEIQKMKRTKEFDENRFNNLIRQNRNFKKQSRQAIAKSMLQAAEFKRAQRRQINPGLGYFKDGLRTFIQGTFLINLRKNIKEKHEMIKQFQQQKKSKDPQKKQRALFKLEFLQKEIISLQKQLESFENSLNVYKQKLKLADKQSNCEFAQKGWPIVYEDYQSLELLGKGGFGEVYKCYDLENNQTIAIKVNHFKQDPQSLQEFIKHVKRQAETMKKLHHPNISKFLKLLECGGNRVTFALQYCSGPQLSNYLKKHICLQEKQAKQIMRQIFSALSYLSSLKEKVIHYDLKPSNIMFHHGLVKILDFGLCKPMGNEESKIALTSQGVGTYWYLPPQTFDEHFPKITPKVDVWSAGVIFYELLYGRKPYGNGISQAKIYNEGIILNAKKVEFPAETPRKFKVSEAAKNFIRQCLTYDQDQRLDACEAYQHEYFKK